MSAGASVPSWGSKFQNKYARFQGVINWFPGHMAKTARQVRETIKKVDLVIEVRDARVSFFISSSPFSSLLVFSLTLSSVLPQGKDIVIISKEQ